MLPEFKISEATSFENLDPDVASVFKALYLLVSRKQPEWVEAKKILTDKEKYYPKLKKNLTSQNRFNITEKVTKKLRDNYFVNENFNPLHLS